MFAGTQKFAERLFLPTECALGSVPPQTGQPAIWCPGSFSPLIRGVVTENAGRIDRGHHARDLHVRARESCIVVCLEFLKTAITRRYPSSSDSTAAYCNGFRTSALTSQ